MSQSDKDPHPPSWAAAWHGSRLDIICCLVANPPMTVEQVVSRTGMSARCARRDISILEKFGLVERDDREGAK